MRRADGRLEARGNVGYWIGRPYWGWATRRQRPRDPVAGFAHLEHPTLPRCTSPNPASGRVLAKCGMVEGAAMLPHRDGAPQEFRTWSITREQWARHQDAPCTRR